MSDPDAKSVLQQVSELTQPPKGSKLSKWQVLVRVIAIGIPILGAIPTAHTLYQSYKHGIPYAEVPHRLKQYKLWTSNIECQINYQALNTVEGSRVDVGACPNTGDILIKVTTKKGDKANYEWIAYNDISGKKKSGGIFGALISKAFAASLTDKSGDQSTRPIRLAETGMTIVCQKLGTKGQIVRIVKENEVCYREAFSLFKGIVEDREEVPCETTCNGETSG